MLCVVRFCRVSSLCVQHKKTEYKSSLQLVFIISTWRTAREFASKVHQVKHRRYRLELSQKRSLCIWNFHLRNFSPISFSNFLIKFLVFSSNHSFVRQWSKYPENLNLKGKSCSFAAAAEKNIIDDNVR